MAVGKLSGFARRGLRGLETDEAFAALDTLVTTDLPHVGVAAVDWARFQAADRDRIPSPLLAGVLPGLVERSAPSAAPLAWAAEPTAPQPPSVDDLLELVLDQPERAREVIEAHVVDRIAGALGWSAAQRRDLGPTVGAASLGELGLDSLMAVQLRNQLLGELGSDIPPTVLLGGGTLSDVVDLACHQLTVRHLVRGASDGAEDEPDDMEVLTL
jgi:hypothetical protein